MNYEHSKQLYIQLIKTAAIYLVELMTLEVTDCNNT